MSADTDRLIAWAKDCNYFGPDDFERLAALAAALEAAEGELQQWRDSIATEALRWRAEAAEAQRDKLAEALRKIANTDPVTGRKIARAALAGAEAQRDTLAKAMLEVERLSHVKSHTWRIARAALAGVAPPEEQHG